MDASNSDILDAIDRSNIGYAIFDMKGCVVHASRSATRLLSCDTHTDITGKPWFDLDHDTADMKTERRKIYDAYLLERGPWQGIMRWVWPDGSRRYYDTTATYYSDDRIIIVINDRTEQIVASRAMEERERLVSSLLDLLPVGVMLQQLDGTILYVNCALAERHGINMKHAVGKRPEDIPALATRATANDLFTEVLDHGSAITARPVHFTDGALKDTHWLFYLYPLADVTGTTSRILTVEFDRTDRTKLAEEKRLYQRKLHELQKIEALNRFAGGLAHELSNILHPAGVYARALVADPDLPDAEKLLTRINESVLQAGHILRQTLDMARGETSGVETVPLDDFLERLTNYANDVAAGDLGYHLEFDERELFATADESELRQVMLNLMVNAADAQDGAGEIVLRAGRGGVPPRDIEVLPASSGPFVWVEVIDAGSGISPDVRRHIFDPFFTTKKKGSGTGLGLAVVQAMVTGWGGVVSVKSAPGAGSTFRIWLPAAQMSGTQKRQAGDSI